MPRGKDDTSPDRERIDAFLDYARERKLVPVPVWANLVAYFRAPHDNRFGQIAIIKGYIQPPTVLRILQRQVDTNACFGQAAIEINALTEAQVEDVLAAQRDPVLLALAILCASRPLSTEDVQKVCTDLGASAPPGARDTASPVSLANGEELLPYLPNEAVRATLRRIIRVASLPKAVEHALVLLEDPNLQIDGVAAALSDAAMSAPVLRLAKLAFLGVRGRVNTLSGAIVTLGTANIRQILLMAAMMDQFQSTGSTLREFWERSLLVAQWARTLARARVDLGVSPELAFTVGNFVDLGEMVIHKHFPEAAAIILQYQREGISQAAAERMALGLTHEDIGSFMCRLWGFPEPFAEAVLYHHATPDALRPLHVRPVATLINAAATLATIRNEDDAVASVAAFDGNFLDYHQLDRHELLRILPVVIKETTELQALLG